MAFKFNSHLLRMALLASILLVVKHQILAQGDIPERPESAVFVADYADMLKPSEERALSGKLLQYDQRTSTQLVVVTISSLNNYKASGIEDLANRWAVKWGVGQKGSDNGALLLIAEKERKMRLEVGYGLEGYIPDLRAQELIDLHLKPNFKSENYYKGINDFVVAVFGLTRGGFSEEDRADTDQETHTWLITSGAIIVVAIIFIVFWNFTRGAHSQRYKLLGQWLHDDHLWEQISNVYFPAQVAEKRQELLNKYALLSSNYSNNRATKELYDELVEVKHSGGSFFTRRNDATLRKAYMKLEEYAQDPLYEQQSCAEVKQGLSAELSYFEPKATEALSEGEKQRLYQAEQHYKPLLTHPENLLDFNIPYLQERIEQALLSDSFWAGFENHYQSSSIKQLKRKWQSEYEQLCRHSEPRARGVALYQFLSGKIERLRHSPHRFLKAKAKPQNTAYPAMTGALYGSEGPMSGNRSDSSGFGSTGSNFGGGDFGGGGASGGW